MRPSKRCSLWPETLRFWTPPASWQTLLPIQTRMKARPRTDPAGREKPFARQCRQRRWPDFHAFLPKETQPNFGPLSPSTPIVLFVIQNIAGDRPGLIDARAAVVLNARHRVGRRRLPARRDRFACRALDRRRRTREERPVAVLELTNISKH